MAFRAHEAVGSGGAGLPRDTARGEPSGGAGGTGWRDGCSGWHQDSELLSYDLNDVSVHCCDAVRILGGCSTLGDSSGLALECVFYPSHEDCQS